MAINVRNASPLSISADHHYSHPGMVAESSLCMPDVDRIARLPNSEPVGTRCQLSFSNKNAYHQLEKESWHTILNGTVFSGTVIEFYFVPSCVVY